MLGSLMKMMPLLAVGVTAAGGSEEMKKVGQEVIGVVQELKTTFEMRQMVKIIRLDMIAGDPIPTDIAKYARANIDSQGTDPAADAWGTLFQLEKEGDGSVYLVSCGPDKNCGNDDDYLQVVIDENGRFQSKYEVVN